VVGCGRRSIRASTRRRESPVAEEVRAEMVANVWKVVAAEGDTVDGR
jgi:biotin carboxyl carrier protein